MRLAMALGAMTLAGCNRARETGATRSTTDTMVTTRQTQDTTLVTHDTTIKVDTTVKHGNRSTRVDTTRKKGAGQAHSAR